ncbi:HIT domain-containing protein [Paenibacillus sp. LMG 31457]|uniref:HIT domain-containing protein n=2 Tax=Paenibacillus planticolens TaxID=2654976 RepID=A0ABX1ZPU5_9BACL|nr:HIT domain-containing protein [Paenibacillus planticolens]
MSERLLLADYTEKGERGPVIGNFHFWTSVASGFAVILGGQGRGGSDVLDDPCLGCRLANNRLEAHIVYETEAVTCLLDHAPLNEGHILILPKQHYADVDDLDESTAIEIMLTSAKLAKALKDIFRPDGITMIQNGGIFNDLTHYHMHIFPRYKEDGFAWQEPADSSNAAGRLAETGEMLREAIGLLR